MKKMKWLIGIFLSLALVFTGCEKNDTFDELDLPGGLKAAKVKVEMISIIDYAVVDEVPELCGSETFELLGGQDIDCGDVVIGNDREYLYIDIHSVDGFDAVEENVKIWIGTDDPATLFSKRPVSGNFPYKFDATGVDFSAKFNLSELVEGYVCEDETPLYVIVHVDAVVDNGDTELDENGNEVLANTETAYAGTSTDDMMTGSAWWYYVGYDPICCTEEPPVGPPTGCSNETAWAGEKGYNIMSPGAWWYGFDANGGATQRIYAGQKRVDGATVTYENGYLTIDLGPNMTLQDVDEPVKVQAYHDYMTVPQARPAAGQFTTYKGNELTFPVGYAYYDAEGGFYNLAIHLDVVVCGLEE